MDTAASDPTEVKQPGFYDNFLQDRNIKWILASGAAILLGSSMMLVSTQWSGYSALLKETIILAYTYGIFAAGKYGYERVGLRRTGTMLLALSLLLAPAACAALPWVWRSASWNVGFGVLLVACALTTWRIGSCTFRHFLLEPQPTLTVSYMLLALAGGILPLATTAAPWQAAVPWFVFAVGAIKGNRRVFWLLEEHRKPRIFGFFPLALLGAQFLGVFALVFAERMSTAWIGFGCVLTAIPLLAAADALAAVFQQRTGNLVRPLPQGIVLPLFAGLLLAATGVVLAGTEINGHPFALVPSAALAAAMLALVARRTKRREFVYAAIALTIVAYRFLPVYAAEAVRQLLQSTASAIHEPKLPIAYYGFTFVPLLAAFSLLSLRAARRGAALFAEPLRRCAVGLGLAFLALSVSHEKAMFPAAATLAVVFAAQTVVFRNRPLSLATIAAIVVAAAGVPAFYNGVLVDGSSFLASRLSPSAWYFCELAVAVTLLAAARPIDAALRRLPLPGRTATLDPASLALLEAPCRKASLLLTGFLIAAWAYGDGLPFHSTFGYTAGTIVTMLALAHAWFERKPAVSVAAVAFGNFVLGLGLADLAPRDVMLFTYEATVLLAQWLLAVYLARRPAVAAAQAYGPALRFCTLIGLGFGFAGLALPLHAWIIGDGFASFDPLWFPSLLLLAWAFAAARHENSRMLASAAIVGLFLYVGSALRGGGGTAFAWILPVWTATAALLLGARRAMRSRADTFAPFLEPLGFILPAASVCLWFLSCFLFSLPATITGFAAPLVLGLSFRGDRHSSTVRLPAAMLNGRLFVSALGLLDPSLDHVGELTFGHITTNAPSMALLAAVSLVAWTWLTRRDASDDDSLAVELGKAQRATLTAVAGLLLAASLTLPTLGMAAIIAVAATFALLVAVELYEACAASDERRVWSAQFLAGVAVAYFAWFGVVRFGRGWSMYVVLAVGLVLWLLAKSAERRDSTAVLARPFRTTASLMPAAVVGLALYRHVWLYETLGRPTTWLGWNSLALLFSAAFYFRRGVETRDARFTFGAAAILNLAVALLWRELKFVDPQFYMIPLGITILALVELLEREIPADYRNPLRYAGALVILVSPTFHIVDGSWLHLFTLMVAAVLVLLAGIGLRTRAMAYAGTAFLSADLAAMVIRGSIDNPELLWVAGLGLGAAILGLGAACELGRERIQQRVRAVGAALESWK